jgi:hypothetical protein
LRETLKECEQRKLSLCPYREAPGIKERKRIVKEREDLYLSPRAPRIKERKRIVKEREDLYLSPSAITWKAVHPQGRKGIS